MERQWVLTTARESARTTIEGMAIKTEVFSKVEIRVGGHTSNQGEEDPVWAEGTTSSIKVLVEEVLGEDDHRR